jgi:hypothetical protein
VHAAMISIRLNEMNQFLADVRANAENEEHDAGNGERS